MKSASSCAAQAISGMMSGRLANYKGASFVGMGSTPADRQLTLVGWKQTPPGNASRNLRVR